MFDVRGLRFDLRKPTREGEKEELKAADAAMFDVKASKEPGPAFAEDFHHANARRHGVVPATIPPLAWSRPCLREIGSASAISP